MRQTYSLVQIAGVLMADGYGTHWGYDLSKRAGVRSGVLYPILTRMLAAEWLVAFWESKDQAKGRRPRRYYQLTDLGRSELEGLLDKCQRDARFTTPFGGN